ncbi:hypothetical protein [Aeromonas hydrophila]|uniref:hypothetical protein n=1 Tax=Aeromonas hydrophila TaxID=644 RepID=UPI001F1EA8C2|nr:hypothetical protein [Aeromonas hydrophila]
MALPAIGGHIHLNHTTPSHQAEASPLLTRGNKLFEQSVQRGIGHFQSSDLKQVISALRQLQSPPDSGNAQRVQDAIQHWKQHHPKEVAARGARLTELKQALAEQGPSPEPPRDMSRK